MGIENIVFETIDSNKDITIKTALIYAGSTELKKQMKRLNVEQQRQKQIEAGTLIVENPA